MSEVLAEPLSIASNNISTTTFKNNTKKASVVRIDKKTDDKYVISNFRPVGMLLKRKLVKSMKVHVSHFISSYRKYNNTKNEENIQSSLRGSLHGRFQPSHI